MNYEEFEYTDLILEANWFLKNYLLEREIGSKISGLAKKADR